MSVSTAKTEAGSVADVAAELRAGLAGDPRLVIYFSSSLHDPAALATAMKDAFPESRLLGCTSSGEIISGAMTKNAVVAMGLGAEIVGEVALTVARGVKAGDPIPGALEALGSELGVDLRDADPEEYVGILLIDGLTTAEEKVNDRIGDRTNVLFVGASAGDDLKFERTHVMLDGEAIEDAAALALLKPSVPFGIIRTQSFKVGGPVLRATKVDTDTRTVLEFDGKPAAQAYADALHVSLEKLPEEFPSHPLGLLAGDDIFVRSPGQVVDGGLTFYCQVLEGMDMHVLDNTDIIGDTRVAVAQKADELGGLSGLVNFNCVFRTLELERRGLCEAYGALFEEVPTVGFSTYGESYIGHVNQTATMLAFGR